MTLTELPPLVERANALARETGFPLTRQEAAPGIASACLPGVGRFLAVLAAGCRGGRIVFDDVTPVLALPPDSPLRGTDVKRQFFSTDSRLISAEVVLPDLQNSLLVGTRLS
jgi:hypothetical protein